MPTASTRATIHLERLRSNVAAILARMPGVEMMGVVKADGYGHGSVAISLELEKLGVGVLGVATVSEGVLLRNAGITSRIIVFSPPLSDRIGFYDTYDLELVIDSEESLDLALGAGFAARCHLKIDTGMGRLGEYEEKATDILRRIERDRLLSLSSVWTHFARADEAEDSFTDVQFERFNDFIGALGGAPAPLHVAASAAVFTRPETVDASRFSMARVGIALYGLLDIDNERPPSGLTPVMELTSQIVAIKWVPAGTPISYGARWRADKETRIATISAGYADGLPRALSNRGSVRIAGELYPIVGTVCMDMIMVDLGPQEDSGRDVRIGDEVSLFGAEAPTCFDVADQASTITYVPVCAVSSRVPRIYIDRKADKDQMLS